MKVILFMAMSLNGMVARKDGDEDFLDQANWETFAELIKQHGCFITGRKTFELIQTWPDVNFDNIEAKLKIIVSKNEKLKLENPYVRASSPKEAIKIAEEQGFASAILVGGSTNNSAFLAENLIDEVILDIEPAIIGKGIPVFAEGDFEARLKFVEMIKITEDILQVRYKVERK